MNQGRDKTGFTQLIEPADSATPSAETAPELARSVGWYIASANDISDIEERLATLAQFHDHRLATLEQENAQLREIVATLTAGRVAPCDAMGRPAHASASPDLRKRTTRRGMLRAAMGTTAAAVGTGLLLETQSGTASAASGVFDASGYPNAAVTATGTNGANGVNATSDSGTAISGSSTRGYGVQGTGGIGVVAQSYGSGAGLSASSLGSGHAIEAAAAGSNGIGIYATSNTSTGIYAQSYANADGVYATSASGNGMHAVVTNSGQNALLAEGGGGTGVSATSNGSGQAAISAAGSSGATGVSAASDSGTAITAASNTGTALHAIADGATPTTGQTVAVLADGGANSAIYAKSIGGGSSAIFAVSTFGAGVEGHSSTDSGVLALSFGSGDGLFAQSVSGNGVHAIAGNATLTAGLAAAVLADGGSAYGIYATSAGPNPAIQAQGAASGIYASSTSGSALHAVVNATSQIAVFAEGGAGIAVKATSSGGSGKAAITAAGSSGANGMTSISDSGVGIYGASTSSAGLYGVSSSGTGVFGHTTSGNGIFASSGGSGVGVKGTSASGLGAYFQGGLAPLRLAAATIAGHPTTGAHSIGEFFVDKNGALFFCVTSGTPGTWKQVTLT